MQYYVYNPGTLFQSVKRKVGLIAVAIFADLSKVDIEGLAVRCFTFSARGDLKF